MRYITRLKMGGETPFPPNIQEENFLKIKNERNRNRDKEIKIIKYKGVNFVVDD